MDSLLIAVGMSALTLGAMEPKDPLTAEVNLVDAYRFVEVYEASDGEPTAEQLQQGYLDGAGLGVQVFTQGRIENSDNLANTIAANRALYERAIHVCLPRVEASNADLRSIYLGLSGLFPDRDLPEIYAVFGANNSGGTAGSGAQVIGIEVVCRVAGTDEEIRAYLRHLYAHETVHVLQHRKPLQLDYTLLSQSIREGAADLVSHIVTGEVPDRARDDWARANEDYVFEQFLSDWAAMDSHLEGLERVNDAPPEAYAVYRRWFSNAGDPPEGWPSELGYWVGRQVCQAYLDNAEDQREALNYLLGDYDPAHIWEASGMAERFADYQEGG